MDNWLKMLVATACIVVCAGGAYFALTLWQEHQKAADDRVAVFEYFNAKPGDIAAATKTCNKVKWNLKNASDLNWNDDVVAYAEKMVALCDVNAFN